MEFFELQPLQKFDKKTIIFNNDKKKVRRERRNWILQIAATISGTFFFKYTQKKIFLKPTKLFSWIFIKILLNLTNFG